MGDLSRFFNRAEFACRCGCGYAEIKPELIRRLELARQHFGAAIKVTSGCRCQKHNQKVKGAANSQHLLGTAADIVVDGVPPAKVAQWFELNWPQTGGVGRYPTFTHVDIRPDKKRWHG